MMTDWRLDGVWAETSLFFGVAEMERVSVGCTDAPSLRTVYFGHGAKATPAHTIKSPLHHIGLYIKTALYSRQSPCQAGYLVLNCTVAYVT